MNPLGEKQVVIDLVRVPSKKRGRGSAQTTVQQRYSGRGQIDGTRRLPRYEGHRRIRTRCRRIDGRGAPGRSGIDVTPTKPQRIRQAGAEYMIPLWGGDLPPGLVRLKDVIEHVGL